ncbi:MAG: OmpA family protein [Odoribacter sp.]|nr:OmpA family protein [Odoribacter sp.]
MLLISGSLILTAGCSSWSKTGKGAAIGGGAGAAAGAGIGAIAGGGGGALIGTAVGGAIGAGTGALIGRRMEKHKQELTKDLGSMDGTHVETIKDKNNMDALKITFDDAILFPVNGTTLNPNARESLAKFADIIEDDKDYDITVYGNTDNTGTREVNERISKERAEAVANFLVGHGISRNRIDTEGLAYDNPVASNSTAEGRAKNRRVEIYVTASEDLINRAERGELND